MIYRSSFVIFAILFSFKSIGQTSAIKENKITVLDQNNLQKSKAWAGGINSGQFSEIDLNMDGILDLFVFDRDGDKISTYINNGTIGAIDYTYAPEYEDKFPKNLVSWVLLADYNNDGKHDIFTYNNGGTRVYKNTSTLTGGVSFQLKEDPYLFTYYDPGKPDANLYTSRTDIPAIVDIDADGDLDILSFETQSRAVTYYENFAIDSGSLEQFRFHVNTYCWGNFEEAELTNKVVLNVSCPRFQVKSGNKHSGSTLLAFDEDGDGDKDLLLGDVSYPNMLFLENGGNRFNANMIRQDTVYPSYSNSIDLRIFPAAYYLDVNNDGAKDLLISPNSTSNIENEKGIYFYENVGSSSSPSFSLTKQDFLQSDMIEMGAGAFPAFLDHNFDGLMDMVVGNVGFYNGAANRRSQLYLYENFGSKVEPKYKLTNMDYAGLSKINLNTAVDTQTFHVVPTFKDINSDGYPDMIIGDYNGKVHLFMNVPKGGISNFEFWNADYLDIDVGQDANPQLFDIDGDGLQDLLIGNQSGRISYFQNKGTKTTPNFTFITNKLGNVKTTYSTNYWGYSQPFFYSTSNGVELLCGSGAGSLFYYKNIRSNLSGSFTLIDTMFLGIDEGSNSHLAMIDLNNDGTQELLIGNKCGGISFFSSDFTVGINSNTSQKDIDFDFKTLRLSKNEVKVSVNDRYSNTNFNVEFISITGQILYYNQFQAEQIINTTAFSSGIYFIRIYSDDHIMTKKYIVK